DRSSDWQQEFEPSQLMEVLKHRTECLVDGQKAEDRVDGLASPGGPEERPCALSRIKERKLREFGNNREKCIDKEKSEALVGASRQHQNRKQTLQDWWCQPE
ncbi:MAG: hypothetical protein ACXV5R_11440, partial [Candidatus Angelobacter sp.]